MSFQARDRPSWAIYNFETEADNFGFSVALGGAITTSAFDEGEDSTTVIRHEPGSTAQASVFLHREPMTGPGGRRLLPSRLEVIPSPDSDELSAVCEEQLVIALRLFKPGFFWVSPWERRDSVRLPGRGLASRPYSLRAEDVRQFAEFSRRLRNFHVERNVYSLIRYYSALNELFDGDVSDFLGPDDQTGNKFLAARAYLLVAADLYEEALREWHLSREMRLVLLMMAAEALFSDTDKGELSHRLAQRIAVLIGPTPPARKGLFEFVKRVYDVRSRLMHGSVYRKKEGFLTIDVADLEKLANAVRAALLYFIALKGMTKEQILKVLDRGMFDDAEALRLRFKANEYWGYGESSDEHLYSFGEV